MLLMARRRSPSDKLAPLRIELSIPVEIIEPAVVEIVRRKQASIAVKLMHRRCKRLLLRIHPRLLWRQIALFQIARGTRGHDVFPGGLAAFAARDNVIESQVVARHAILTGEAIAQEYVEPGKGGMR